MEYNHTYHRFWLKIKVLLICLVLMQLFIYELHAQDNLYMNGLRLTILHDTLSVNGNVVVNANNMQGFNIHNAGIIKVSDSIINKVTNLFWSSSNPFVSNDLTPSPVGEVIFEGTGKSVIIGNDTLFFNDITVTDSNEVQLNTNIESFGIINLIEGKINLNGRNILLYDTLEHINRYSGYLNTETNTFHIYDDSVHIDTVLKYHKSGVIEAYTPTLDGTNNLGGLGAEITRSAGGNMIVQRGHASQPDAADGSVRKYYRFFSNNAQNNQVTVKINYLDSTDFGSMGIDEPDFSIFSKEYYLGLFKNREGILDTINNHITIENVDPFGHIWTIADEQCDNPPIVDLGEDIMACQYDTLSIGNADTSLLYFWSSGDSTQYITVNTETTGLKTYIVRADNIAGCYTFDTIHISVKARPETSFDLSTMVYCQSDTINLEDNSTISEGSIDHYTWVFSDLDTVRSANTNKLFSAHGEQLITLITESDFGCEMALTENVTINPLPQPVIAADYHCMNKSVSLQNHSHIAEGAILQSTWTLEGNEQVATQPMDDVNYTFFSEGEQLVKLELLSQKGCINSITDTLGSYLMSEASFRANNICEGDTLIIENSSIEGNANIQYLWTFGDEGQSTDKDPVHIYDINGNMDVELVVFDRFENDQFCSDTVSQIIQVDAKPNISFSYEEECEGQNVRFEAINVSSLSYFEWIFPTFNLPMEQQTDVLFDTAGTYMVMLRGVNDIGCDDIDTQYVTIHPAPEVDFSSPGGCEFNEISFYNQTTIADDDTIHYTWLFGDGTDSEEVDPVHVYQEKSGSVDVTLQATSGFGCEALLIKPIEVKETPEIGFPDTIKTCGSSYVLSPKEEANHYLWSNGATEKSLIINSDASYSLTITADNGCINADSTTVLLNETFTIDLGTDTTVCDSLLLKPDVHSVDFLWSNNQTSDRLMVKQTGMYSLKVTDQNNCIAQDTIEIIVDPVLYFSLGDTYTKCDGDTLVLDPGLSGLQYIWSNGSVNQFIEVTYSGNYELTITNESNCQGYDEVDVIFNPSPLIDLEDYRQACNETILDAGNPGDDYTWSTGASTQTITVTEDGIYGITVSNSYGCSDNHHIEVDIDTMLHFSIGADTSVCDSVRLIPDMQGQSYLWSTGQETDYGDVYQSGVHWLRIDDFMGCYGYDSIEVTVFNTPLKMLGNDIEPCIGTEVTLDAGNAGSYYLWSDGTTEQTITIDQSKIYSVKVTNPGYSACQASDEIQVLFVDYPDDWLPDELIICGDTTLIGDDRLRYNWSTGNDTPNQYINTEGKYYVTITSGDNCSTNDSTNISIRPMLIIDLGQYHEICAGDTINLQTPFDSRYNYEWSNGSNMNEIAVGEAGIYSVIVSSTINSCVKRDSAKVVILPLPYVNIGNDTVMCEGDSILLDANGSGLSYNWWNDGQWISNEPAIYVYQYSNYKVALTNEHNCLFKDSVTVDSTELSITTDFLLASEVIVGDTIIFIDMSTPSITDHHWDFGDYETSDLAEPGHIYYVPGSLTVELMVSNELCDASLQKNIEVKPMTKSKDLDNKNMFDPKLVSIENIKLYPNPSQGQFWLSFNLTNKADVLYYFFDMNGNIIYMKKESVSEHYESSFDLSHLTPGMYFVRIVAGKDTKLMKIIKY
jgi:hypothetical protein